MSETPPTPSTLPPDSRLFRLIGDSLFDLPPYLVERLEAKLADLQETSAGYSAATRSQPAPAPTRPCVDLRQASRMLHSVDVILEILEVSNQHRLNGADAPLLADHLIEGLLEMARDIADSAAETLACPSWQGSLLAPIDGPDNYE